MNRGIVGVGVGTMLVGIALLVYPIATTGVETLNAIAQVGFLSDSIAVGVILIGAASPDPRVTTVGGAFGNPVENEMRLRRAASPAHLPARSRGSPREPTNCGHCYTLVPWDLKDCPRCAHPRDCRGCGGVLEYQRAVIACSSCGRPEVTCNCRAALRAARGPIPLHRRVL